MIGLSIRLALALGLHLRNEDPSLDEAKKESLAKTWWCLHSIECLVSSITGRPPVVGNEDCTVSLPRSSSVSSARDSDTSRQASRIRTSYSSPHATTSSSTSEADGRSTEDSRYLITYINLTLISQKVLLNLYSPRTAVQSWEVHSTPFLFWDHSLPCDSHLSLLTETYSMFKQELPRCSKNLMTGSRQLCRLTTCVPVAGRNGPTSIASDSCSGSITGVPRFS